MLRPPRFGACMLACTLSAFGVAGVAPTAFAEETGAADTSEGIDDPKLERRLGTRLALGADPAGAPPDAASSPAGDAAAPGSSSFAGDVVIAEATPDAGQPKVPRLKLAYRWFTFAQIGPVGAASSGASEVFHVVSLDLYPVSTNWRFGLSTQYGWQDGQFRENKGDAFLAETLSLGGQLPGDKFTPFFEVFGGGGFMQRPHAVVNTVATAFGELGVDVGTEIFFARHAYLSLAGGYLHSVNGFGQANKLTTISGNTLSFKIGFGI
jgi:hypothetical protein